MDIAVFETPKNSLMEGFDRDSLYPAKYGESDFAFSGILLIAGDFLRHFVSICRACNEPTQILFLPKTLKK